MCLVGPPEVEPTGAYVTSQGMLSPLASHRCRLHHASSSQPYLVHQRYGGPGDSRDAKAQGSHANSEVIQLVGGAS